MCGRMTLSRRDIDEVADELEAVYRPEMAALYRPRFNVAPTDWHPLLRAAPGGGDWGVGCAGGGAGAGARRWELVPARWGLAGPELAREPGYYNNRLPGRPGRGPLLINARSETAHVLDSFREAFARRRCVIPADGFYEWKGGGETRQPFWLHPPDGRLLLFAGLYDEGPDGEMRFTVLTTTANRVVAALHDRMPVILAPRAGAGDGAADAGAPDAVARWLRDGPRDLLRPAPEGALVATPVSRRVNSVKYDDPACLLPEAEGSHPQDRQLRLFPL
jgi:putative SOS response-associated peptidase YedK